MIQQVYFNNDGSLAAYAPDMQAGYTADYRASPKTGLGAWKAQSLELNRNLWGADHCFDPQTVPGVLFYSGDLSAYPAPSYHDIPALAIDVAPDARGATPPPTLSAEDQEKLEERLKSLGYL